MGTSSVSNRSGLESRLPSGSLVLGGTDEVGQEQRVRQRAHAAGNGGDRRGNQAGGREVDVTHDPALDDVDPDIDDDRSRLEHRSGDQSGASGGHHDDIGPPDVAGKVAGPAVAYGD